MYTWMLHVGCIDGWVDGCVDRFNERMDVGMERKKKQWTYNLKHNSLRIFECLSIFFLIFVLNLNKKLW